MEKAAQSVLSALSALSAVGLVLLGGCSAPDETAVGGLLDGAADSMTPDSAAADSPAGDSRTGDSTGDGAVDDAGDASRSCPPAPPGADGGAQVPNAGMTNLVPVPVSVVPAGGSFALAAGVTIRVDPATPEMTAVAGSLAAKLRAATSYAVPVVPSSAGPTCAGDLVLTTAGGDSTLGSEGYDLAITADQVRLSAYQPEGIFRGLQTLRQLLPAAIEAGTVSAGPWGIATGTIHDSPRFAWRGTMLDVARHFFGVQDVETYIDLLAYYKINTFHIHLSDDQGWRIVINSWPNLATYGGSTEVDGGPGGYYTQADYSAIVAYAKDRYITVVPEIDMPGHTTAALASYANLNCNGVAPPLDTNILVGISSLCVSDDATYTFAANVISEVAGLSPGPYFHIGGDEATATTAADFQTFFARVQPFVQMAGKQMVGWDAVGQLTTLLPGSVVQYWAPADANFVTDAISQNAKVLMSPDNKAYMDMKYDSTTVLGRNWAGYIDEQAAYSWDPAALLSGVTDAQLVGLEAPLWTETLVTLADVEYMAFPRIAGYAEIGWSPSMGRSWDEYKTRIGAQGPRLRALGVNYHTSSLIPWQ
jgi:hexosaminidase